MTDQFTIAAIRLPTAPADRVRWAVGAAIVVLIGIAYWSVRIEGHFTTYTWLVNQWTFQSNYSHGPLVPLIAAGLVWMKWREILRAAIAPIPSATALLLPVMLVYYVGARAIQGRIVVFSFIMLLAALALALGGREVFRAFFFPILFLILMIPFNFLDEIVGFPMRLLMARASTVVLNGIGIVADRQGTIIRSDVFDFDVANPCSGIRSLMAMITVTAAFAYVTQRVQWKRWVLFLAAIPLAVLGNMARVVGIALVGQVFGHEIAMQAHDYSGFIVFGVALTAMVALGFALNVPYARIIQHWFKPLPATAPTTLPDPQPQGEP